MKYYQIPPSPALERYVQYFWVFEEPEDDPVWKTYKIVADGAPGMVFQYNRAFFDTKQELFPCFFLYGQATSNMYNTSRGGFVNVGVVLKPDAVKTVFGIDSIGLTNTWVDGDLLGQQHFSDILLNSGSIENAIRLLGDYILRMAERHHNKSNLLATYASHKLLKDPCEHRLKEVQQELKISERSLERLFRTNIGMSPKLFARVCRFQASLHSLRGNGYEKLSDISYGNGYADQSHFIRDFREFSGVTPKAWLRKAVEVAENYPQWKV